MPLLSPVSEHGYGLGLSGWGTRKGGDLGVLLLRQRMKAELDSPSSEDSTKSLPSVCNKDFFFKYHLNFYLFSQAPAAQLLSLVAVVSDWLFQQLVGHKT